MAETPTPRFRKLRVFALDPSLGSSLKTYELRTDTIPVRYEHETVGQWTVKPDRVNEHLEFADVDPASNSSYAPVDPGPRRILPELERSEGQSTLKPGPVGEYLEVVDVDPASNLFYAPVDLDDLRILATDGLEPSEGNPQFHQQMVYAVAMRTIEIFEQALGRVVLWQPQYPDPKAEKRASIYVPRLRLYPHALRAQNAYYSPNRRAILFGYFPSEASDDAMTPGGTMVFSCLSSDIIAHEMTHAILDGAARGYLEDSNPDVLAFHEGFADIVALFEHFMYPQLVASEIARAHGTSAMDLLSGLAKQFGESTQRGGALRDYSNYPDKLNYRTSFEVHDRGSILVKAVYDAFIAIVERRSAGLIELATGGSGVLEPGALHPTLVARLTDETIRAARHVLRMCIRAIDYCPPVDIDFGTYLRALITADLAQVDEDRYNYRTAFLESFRRWGLLPRNLRTVSLETLQWQHPPKRDQCKDPEKLVRDPTWLPGLLNQIQIIDWRAKIERETIFDQVEQRARRVHNFLAAEISKDPNVALQLGLEQRLKKYDEKWGSRGQPVEDSKWVKKHADDPNYTCFNVESARVATRTRPGEQPRDEVIIVIKQKRPRRLANGRYFWFRGGVTLVIDPLGADGKSPEILHSVTRSMDKERLKRERQYREGDSAAGLRLAYFRNAMEERELFALLHARDETDGES